PAGDDRAPGAVLGPDREHVDRQPHAAGAQPAAGRRVDQIARGALPAAVSRDLRVLLHRRLHRRQQGVRRLRDRRALGGRLRAAQARLRARAHGARIHPRADDGGEPAPRDDDLVRRPDGLDHAADLRRLPVCRRRAAPRHRAAGATGQARRGDAGVTSMVNRDRGDAETLAKVVHCNGYSLAEDPRIPRDKLDCAPTEGRYSDWEHVCWGDQNMGARGRIPMRWWLARHVDASLIIWSTGASRIIGGDYEAMVFLNRALLSFAELKTNFPDRFKGEAWSS